MVTGTWRRRRSSEPGETVLGGPPRWGRPSRISTGVGPETSVSEGGVHGDALSTSV